MIQTLTQLTQFASQYPSASAIVGVGLVVGVVYGYAAIVDRIKGQPKNDKEQYDFYRRTKVKRILFGCVACTAAGLAGLYYLGYTII